MADRERPIGEDDLHAYVDGRLAPERRRLVDAYLAEQPEQLARLRAYASDREAMCSAFQGRYSQPIPTRLRVAAVMARRRRGSRGRVGASIAASLLVVVGIGIGWILNDYFDQRAGHVAVSVPNDAISAYRTYVGEVLHAVEVDASQEKHLVQWLSRRLGRPLVAPDLTPIGFRLMGGRLLPAGSGPAAQMMYENGQGQRLTLYLRPGEVGETSFRFVEKDGISAFYWIDDGFAYAVSAKSDRENLLKAAEAVYKQVAPQ